MTELVEATPVKRTNSIFAVNQSDVLLDPEKAKALDREGNFVEARLPSEELVYSHYWSKQSKTVAFVGIVSAGALMVVLLNETDLLETIFGTALNLLWGLLSWLIAQVT